MYAHLTLLHAVLLITMNLFDFTEQEDLKFKIGLPEYICDKDGSVRDVTKDMTTIRLLGADAQTLNYQFNVNFKRLGSGCQNNQRCTLLIWKAVRELDDYLRKYPADQMQTGLIEINNTMFVPGIQYILNVTVQQDGNVVEEKQLTLDYVDEDVKNRIAKPMASVQLLGADMSYAYTTFVVNADTIICSNISNYYFNWELLNGNDEESNLKFYEKGAELRIPPDTLQALKSYTIKCDLVKSDDGAVLASNVHKINILSRGLLVDFPLKIISTKPKQAVKVKAYVKDLDNSDGDILTEWSCVNLANNENCDYLSDTNELDMDAGLAQIGDYKVSLQVSKGDFTETASCQIRVMQDVPLVEIADMEMPINPSGGVEVRATVYQLRTFCSLQWTTVQEGGFESLDLTSVPGDVAALVNVTLKEDLFLNELEEFSNGTIDRDHDLIIPPPSEDWPGLKGDSAYLFRLLITCPPILPDRVEEENGTEPILQKAIAVATDVAVRTNAPPQMKKLEVTPGEGEAFVTTFSFKTQKAVDKDGDAPFLYQFGYILDERLVILWSFSDITNAEATLPYSTKGIETFLECCDTFNSCGRISGPVIKTSFPQETTSAFFRGILQPFIEKLATEEYYKAFSSAIAVVHSYRSIGNPDREQEARDFISSRIGDEIAKFLALEQDDGNQWKIAANNLIRNINDFNNELQLPETTLSALVDLRNKLSDDVENLSYTQRRILSRMKRADTLSLQDVKGYLEVSELIITKSSDVVKINSEKENLRKQLVGYMEKLCHGLSKNMQLELKTLIFSVEKLTKSSFNTFLVIPYEKNPWKITARIKLGMALYENNKPDTGKLCIGKAIFKDYLGKSGITYFADVFNAESNKAGEITIFLPLNQSFGNPSCLFYRGGWNSDCKVLQVLSKYVKCSCKNLGYFYLDYSDTPSPTEPVAPEATSDLSEEFLNASSRTDNSSSLEIKGSNFDDTISYVVISASIIGIVILAVILRRIMYDDEPEESFDHFEFPKYAQLHDEEQLNDAHI